MTAVQNMTMAERELAAAHLVNQIPTAATAMQEADLAASRQRQAFYRMLKQAVELGVTQQRISDATGLSRQRVQQIVKAAVDA